MNLPGKRIVGAAMAAKLLHDSTEGKRVSAIGKRISGKKEPPAPPPGSYSVAQVVEGLRLNPSRVDEFLKAELARPEGPRKSALRALLVTEEANSGGREVVVRSISDLITPPADTGGTS